jgi:AraC family transcriptional regulator
MIYRKLHDCSAEVRERCMLALRDENVIVSARVRAAELPVYERLNSSIHCVHGGAEAFELDRRRVPVDDDSYLLINAARPFGSRIDAAAPVHTFSVHFRRGLAAEIVASASAGGLDAEPHSGAANGAEPIEFIEHLAPNNPIVSPALRRLMRAIEDEDADTDDPEWLEEQCAALLARILRWHHGIGASLDGWYSWRKPLRREVERRIGRATELMLAGYAQPLTLQRLADEACLSRFHFVRLFRAVHQVSPYAFLQRRRCAVAARLLADTEMPVEAIAHAVGIANRVTLFRLIRKHTSVSPRALRAAASAPLPSWESGSGEGG